MSEVRSLGSTWLVAILVVLLMGKDSWGQTSDNMANVRQAYQRGFEEFTKKKYKEALRYFSRAIKWLPKTKKVARTRGELRYFLGMCYYHLGRWQKARILLNLYLHAKGTRTKSRLKARRVLQAIKTRLAKIRRRPVPSRPVPVVVQRRVPKRQVAVGSRPLPTSQPAKTSDTATSEPAIPDALRQFVSRGEPESPHTPVPSPPARKVVSLQGKKPFHPSIPPVPGGRGPSVVSYIFLGVGVAALVAGGISVGLALSDKNQYDEYYASGPNPKVTAKAMTDLYSKASMQATASYILFGAGGAIAITGLILLFTTGKKAPARQKTLQPPPPRPLPPQPFLFSF